MDCTYLFASSREKSYLVNTLYFEASHWQKRLYGTRRPISVVRVAEWERNLPVVYIYNVRERKIQDQLPAAVKSERLPV